MVDEKKRGLGRGLSALLGSANDSPPNEAEIAEISVADLQAGRYQPRTHFSDKPLLELSESIKSQGVIQPVVVRPIRGGGYEIIAGERRWRAAQLAGLDSLPCVIKKVDGETAIAMALIENIQREDLTPLEQAGALQRLIDEFELTHQAVAEAVGKSRSSVTNLLRLMNLHPAVADILAAGDLEMGHARALLTLPADKQPAVAEDVVTRGFNVRQTEAFVKRYLSRDGSVVPAVEVDPLISNLEKQLANRLGQTVRIKCNVSGAGKITIGFSSLSELNGVLASFGFEQ